MRPAHHGPPPLPLLPPAAGVIFFSLVLFSGPLEPSLAAMGLTPLYAAVLVGAAQNIFSKSSKYSLFDPCKEMAYIPLDSETKVGGKGARGSQLGNAGGLQTLSPAARRVPLARWLCCVPGPLGPRLDPGAASRPSLHPQTKGKAAIDVICNPLGKSGGALIQQVRLQGARKGRLWQGKAHESCDRGSLHWAGTCSAA